MSYNHLNVTGRVFVNTSLCPYYRISWGQCKSLVNKKKIHQVFCLRDAVSIKVYETFHPKIIFQDVVSIKVYETSHPNIIFHVSNIPVVPE